MSQTQNAVLLETSKKAMRTKSRQHMCCHRSLLCQHASSASSTAIKLTWRKCGQSEPYIVFCPSNITPRRLNSGEPGLYNSAISFHSFCLLYSLMPVPSCVVGRYPDGTSVHVLACRQPARSTAARNPHVPNAGL